MRNSKLLAVLLLAAGAWLVYDQATVPPPPPTPDDRRPLPPQPAPTPPPRPQPPPRPKPWGATLPAPVGASVGGAKHPDGTEIDGDLPGSWHQRNIASKGLGCCVFRSIDHAARLQNVPCLWNMPEWMVKSGIEGGGYPSKVAQLIPRMARDKGVPTPAFVQVEGMDMEPLKLASRTGRMSCVTYSISPTGRYGGSRIAHMVNLAHCDDRHVVVLDNNYVGDNAYEWMNHAEFKRAYAPGWAVILLAPPPPPPPKSNP